MSKHNKVARRINEYYGEGTWDRLKDLDKEVFIKEGAYKIWKMKQEGILPRLSEIGALKETT